MRVNCVAPGLTKTPLNEGVFLEKILPTVPMKRYETADEVAKVFVFVASEATFMTGQTILSDGGVSVGLK
ncbi:SDR family oxidoreductase [Lactiplantibacillus fabifermentans]|uniref:SDR family oxidoreductase n=1 Tax=Lactiplantibacillus fabifermentans TaxID=483011 RepID=UPI002286E821|nr:SDR family oxidoreductase [Lactiplantibacillus fabifermentans]